MFKNILYIIALLVIVGCSTSPNDFKITSVNNSAVKSKAHSTQITLSHIKAYLLLGNIKKAEQLFQTLETPELNAQAMLTLAELHSARGKSIEAQKVFLLALTDNQFGIPLNKSSIPAGLLDYFCEQKKWPALQGYGAALINTANDDNTKLTNNTIILNGTLTKIGLCFFYLQRWDDTTFWLEQVDLTKQVNPLIYLALARAKIEQQQYSDAQRLITQYEQKKDMVDAQTLWVAIEVYQALNQPDMVLQVGENLRSLYSTNEYTRKYILAVKRGERLNSRQQKTTALIQTTDSSAEKKQLYSFPGHPIHIMKKGETLYQLSKRYDVSIADLLKWNPDLVVNDIALGASVRLFAD